MSGDFNRRLFLAGPLVGLRSFRVTDEGWLTGVVYRAPVKPGVNDAMCLFSTGSTIVPRTERAEHVLAGRDCTCGFYAYFDGDNDYHTKRQFRDETVAGVVEAGGVMTVGDRGFRASQIRLLGLVQREPHPLIQFGGLLLDLVRASLRDPMEDPPLDPEPGINWAGIRRNYPGVWIYPSVRAALAAHPLTVPKPEVAA